MHAAGKLKVVVWMNVAHNRKCVLCCLLNIDVKVAVVVLYGTYNNCKNSRGVSVEGHHLISSQCWVLHDVIFRSNNFKSAQLTYYY